jgi:acetyltransferase-like isoleucine patch superfamily enzyme
MSYRIERLWQFLRSRRKGIDIDPSARTRLGSVLSLFQGGTIRLGAQTSIMPRASLITYGGSISIGKRCTVNSGAVLYGQGGLVIGDDVRIAANTVIIPSNHTFDRRDIPIGKQPTRNLGIRIEDDVWIGANCTILDGVVIGRGCVVGAGSVVSRSLQPYGVYVGVPARLLRVRPE